MRVGDPLARPTKTPWRPPRTPSLDQTAAAANLKINLSGRRGAEARLRLRFRELGGPRTCPEKSTLLGHVRPPASRASPRPPPPPTTGIRVAAPSGRPRFQGESSAPTSCSASVRNRPVSLRRPGLRDCCGPAAGLRAAVTQPGGVPRGSGSEE